MQLPEVCSHARSWSTTQLCYTFKTLIEVIEP